MMRWRVLVSLAAAACAAVAAADAAHGATVSPQAASLVFVALPGETNHVTVAPGTMPMSGAPAIMLTDPATTTSGPANLTPTAPCVQGADMQTALCPADGVTAAQLTLGGGDDWLVNGTTLAVQAFGADAQDNLRGGSGNEHLEGGAGADDIDAGGGNDLVFGATLQDPGAGAASDLLAGGPGDDRVFGSGGGDRVDGGPGADQLEGGGGADTMPGADGTDSLTGGDGDDTEDGGPGVDTIFGGRGNDTIVPGPGGPLPDADIISGATTSTRSATPRA
jgi:Ca2+-binding RTX toxin-like protein